MPRKGLSIRGQVRPPEVLQELPPPGEHGLEPSRGTPVLPVVAQVVRQARDALRERRDLGLGGARVSGEARGLCGGGAGGEPL